MTAAADGLEILEDVQTSVPPREPVVRHEALAAPAVDTRCCTRDECREHCPGEVAAGLSHAAECHITRRMSSRLLSAAMATTRQEAFDLGDRTVAVDEAPEERAGVFRRLRKGLSRSRQALSAELSSSFTERIDEQTWEHLEEALILADVGAPTTAAVVRRLEDEVEAGELSGGEALRDRLIEVLAETACPQGPEGSRIHLRERPSVLMVVGVNGTGKTTTIGKVAWHLQKELGLDVIVAA